MSHEIATDRVDVDRSDVAAHFSDPDLFREQSYLDGLWRDADDGRRIPVANPADRRELGSVPDLGASEVGEAVVAAEKALPAWRALTGAARGALLHRWRDEIARHADDLALLLTLENGKPLAEARAEISYALSFVDWFGEEARRTYGEVIPQTRADQRLMALRQPVGVCAAITAWNFPSALVTRKAAPALAAGCSMVLKPSELTPFSALALAELAERAGLPGGVFNVVTGDAVRIGQQLCEHSIVRKLSFTGSTAVGQQLMRQCASTTKRLSLELGGNAPFIVFDDADLDRAAEGLVAAKFRNSGQTCICANRIFVHDIVHDRFADKLATMIKALRVGDGRAAGTTQGPLISEAALSKVERLVDDAVRAGAKVRVGGGKHALGGYFYEPTLLVDVKPSMEILTEEIFGPVAAMVRFRSDEEVLNWANASSKGLAAYVFSRDLSRVWRTAEALECGMVGVNTGIISNEAAPFGGVKDSGFGREGSKHGINEFLEIKYVCVGL